MFAITARHRKHRISRPSAAIALQYDALEGKACRRACCCFLLCLSLLCLLTRMEVKEIFQPSEGAPSGLLRGLVALLLLIELLLLSLDEDGSEAPRVQLRGGHDPHENFFLKLIHTSIIADCSPGESRQIRYFHLHHVKYVWDNENASFSRLLGLEGEKYTIAQLLDHSQGLTLQEQQQKLQLYGKNVIDIEVKSYWTLFVEEVFNPFYIFQVFSVILWSLDDYYYYAGCVFVLSAISIITSLIQTKKQSLALYDLVAASNVHTVTVCYRDGHCNIVEADLLVPGDLILIPPHGCHMTCDALLLSGNCIVNESMLTGECVPVTKTPPSHSDEIYDPNFHKRHTLFSGTHVIQTRFYGNNKVTAVVIRTGFYTSKGELIRSILFPKPVDFKFYSDAFKFVVMLFCVALIGMAYCIYLYVIRFADIETILLRTLDIVTIVVPPALPAAMTVGTVYSLNRLKKLKIFCIAPPKINICGKVKLVCFDKTGTLTEDGLDIWGVLGCENSKFHSSLVSSPLKLDVTSPLVAAMATCHTLTNIEGKLTGDPLDLTMFEATQWDLIEPGQDTNRYDMLTPTVVKPMRKISCLCRPNSIPEDFGSVLMNFTSAGYRVIALSYKPMDLKFNWLQAQKIKREQETRLIINTLMPWHVLGDNILTAVSVARNCGMVLPNEWVIQVKAQAPDETHSSRITYKILDTTVENSYAYSDCMSIMECEKWHFALDGKSWAAVCSHFPELLPYILTKGIVFSRMGPDQKTQLVEYLQNLDYIVAMCGDGANDCGALKAAHIGISLSEAEASVAAPFTSQIANIKCVLHLIREGRCALVTSFGVFKFMALYSLIQFISVLLLYMHGTMLGNVQFLYIDLVSTNQSQRW
uniref:Cation-transporting P-type ATPase N-terminal domain-containing protein n=1 Tax=Timema poppense TaxID=170557 RepID=A0A7R9CV21_TIMPO|nr:unnamed protein product [Timema poppensis]